MSKKTVEKKIMVFATFDGLNPGHINFFEQARKLTPLPFLVVSIARDKNVKKIKGKYPELKENARMRLVKSSPLVDKVVLSGIKDHIPHILKIGPNIIALGYDQKEYVKDLKKDLKYNGISVSIVRLKPYKEKIYKNQLLKK